MRIHLDNTHSVGLGDHLCLISLLCDLPEQVEVLCSNAWNTFDRLAEYKRVLNIPDSKFVLIPTDSNGDFPVIGWPAKLFSPYYQVETNRTDKRKPCIGLVCYTTNQMYMDSDYSYIEWENNVPTNKGIKNTFPHCKLRPIDYYARVFEYIKRNRYDVITIDSMDTNFEEKVEMMSKYCEAIIGYEGGIAHLSHMLNIPYFILGWRLPSPSTHLETFHSEIVHMTRNTYFLRDDEELFSWSAEEFDYQINLVRTNHGNNRLLNGECYLEFPRGISGPIEIKDLATHKSVLSTTSILGSGPLTQLLQKYKR